MGGQSARKIEILGALGDIMLETFILVDFCMIFDKIDDEKYIDFLLCLLICLVFLLMLETLKIVLPSRRELNFYKIAFFALDEKRHCKYIKKGTNFNVNFESETCEKLMQTIDGFRGQKSENS